jgi:glutathione synthase/RimK-type ligase-like ATP-grasp enzyme
MNNENVFDVLIVYSGVIARSAAKQSTNIRHPFSNSSRRANYNDAYAYLLKMCKKQGLKAAFSISSDIIGAGTCDSYWLFEDEKWKRIIEHCYSRQIFDKFSPVSKKRKMQRELLFSSELVQPFNDPVLASLFFDKLKTFETLSTYAIPTVAIVNTDKFSIEKSIRKLRRITRNHTCHDDFTRDIILKDRFGAGGNNIYRISKNYTREIGLILEKNKRVTFILQPFTLFDSGYSYKGHSEATDIRLIYQNGNIIQTYIRMAKINDFRCNEHQGGSLVYVNRKDIPKKVFQISEHITKELDKNNSLFALDFIVSNNGNVYFLEGNIGPGLDWNLSLKKNERLSKKLIRGIVNELSVRSSRIRLERGIECEVGSYDLNLPMVSVGNIY